jgi:hypothetical protein
MNSRGQFGHSTYAGKMHIAERELSAFIGAVTQLFGPEEAKLSAEDDLFYDYRTNVDAYPKWQAWMRENSLVCW